MEQNLLCSGCGMPRDDWWIYDPDTEREKVERALEMAKLRKCATCYAAEYRHERHRENGEMKGSHVVFEPLPGS